MELDIDALFALADAAAQEEVAAGEETIDSLEELGSLFSNGAEMRTRPARSGKPEVVLLGNGDYHVCFGCQCSEVRMDRERQLVCDVSGHVVGKECSRGEDPSWTGRSTASANPDDASGAPAGGWIKRRDMFAASSEAWARAEASGLDGDSQYVPDAPEPPLARSSSKRGALCVDQVEMERGDAAKRPRIGAARPGAARQTDEKLEKEASDIIDTLMRDARVVVAAPAPAPADPRLQNVDFVRQLALKRYVKKCASGEASLSMDGVHDVCVWANEFVRDQRRQAADAGASASASASASRTLSGQVRRLLGRLVVVLWNAAGQTPHMTNGRRGGDSFRPFAAGVLYQLKRGLYMSDGGCIIPCLPELSDLLPALRCPNASAAAKQLQSSSHRGICSLHKSLSSIEEMHGCLREDAKSKFSSAVNLAAMLRAVVAGST